MMKKKGQASQNVFVAVFFLFSFGILSIIGALVTYNILDEFATLPMYDSNMASASGGFRFAITLFDKIAALFMVVFIIGIGVTSFRLATSQVFFLVSFVMAAFYGLASYYFNYIFAQIIGQSVFLSITAIFPVTILICTNLHWVALAMVVVGSITLYAKKERGQFLT